MWLQIPLTGTILSLYSGAMADVYALLAKTTHFARIEPRDVVTVQRPSSFGVSETHSTGVLVCRLAPAEIARFKSCITNLYGHNRPVRLLKQPFAPLTPETWERSEF